LSPNGANIRNVKDALIFVRMVVYEKREERVDKVATLAGQPLLKPCIP